MYEKLAQDIRDYCKLTKQAQSAKQVSNLLLGTPWGKGKSSADMEMAARLVGLIGGGAAGAYAGHSTMKDDDSTLATVMATLLGGGAGALAGSRGAGALDAVSRGISHEVGKSLKGKAKSPLLHGQIPSNDPHLRNLVQGDNAIRAFLSVGLSPQAVPFMPITNQLLSPVRTGLYGAQKGIGALIPR